MNQDVDNWINQYRHKHFYADIPDNFEEYFKKIDVASRTAYRRSIANNYVFDEIFYINPLQHKEILNIWLSKEIRQNRVINFNYVLPNGNMFNILDNNCWPISNYIDKNQRFFVVKLHDVIVGYCEIYIQSKDYFVHSILGHAEHLRNGIMKYLILEIIKNNITEIHKFYYGIKPNTNFFLKDLLIIN